ncbi:MAG: cell division protein CrgA [Actinomycetota bacterium]|nr:cell division protein CrgA [Actinomycetota bacterium]
MATKRTRGGSGRTTAKGATTGSTSAHVTKSTGRAELSGRYTPPTAADLNAPSRLWVPVLMFSMLGVGALLIILNYVGALGGVNNVWLVVGLACILAGIITATQYR